MADFGLYTSLAASPHFDVRRRDAAQNLIIAQKMRDDAVLKTQNQMQSMGAISEYLNKSEEKANELLPQDADRVKAKDLSLRKEFLDDEVLQHDPQMFMMMGGTAKLDKYKNALSGSEELRTGLENKKNFALGTEAIMKGDWIGPVEVEFNGGTKQTVPWTEALDLHQQGVIKKLPFRTSGQMGDFDPLDFMRFETPDADVKHKGFVGLQYVADRIQAANPKLHLSNEDALDQAKHYANPDIPGATMFTWGRRLPHTSGGSNSFGAKQLADQQNVFQRYQYLKQGINTNPALIGQMIMNQPYNGGFITGFKIIPEGKKVKQSGTGKIGSNDHAVALVEYSTKGKYGTDTHQEEIHLNKDNDYGFQFFNKLANVNREGTAQFVTPEDLNMIYQSDPEYFGGGQQKQQGTPTPEESKVIGGKTYVKVNGQWFEQ